MKRSDWIDTYIKPALTDDEKDKLVDAYVGLEILKEKFGDTLDMDGTALSHAVGLIPVLQHTILSFVAGYKTSK
jgi:hypothetical protein